MKGDSNLFLKLRIIRFRVSTKDEEKDRIVLKGGNIGKIEMTIERIRERRRKYNVQYRKIGREEIYES